MNPTDMRPFIATGNTLTLSATSSPQTAAISAARPKNPEIPGTMRIANLGTDTVWINQGATAALAAAAITSSPSIPIPAGNTEVIQMAGDTAFIGYICTTSTATVYVTPGQGA